MSDKSSTNKKESVERDCTVQESLKQSLRELKLIRQGKLKAKPWRELFDELNAEDEQDEVK